MYENLKKKFGQNFLTDKNILRKISDLIPKENLNIIEIGPGDGRLTEYIIKKNPKKLTLIEKDSDLMNTLNKMFSKYKNVNILNLDFLKIEIKNRYQLIISNLPYNISSQIIAKISLLNNPPDLLILMFQKEFAKRLTEKKINSINSLVNCFYEINLKFEVSRNCFRPIPKVDSSVLLFIKKKDNLLERYEIDKFIEFKRNLFSHKRKTLKNLLRKFKLSSEYNLNLRVEELELKELISIFRSVNS
tara:strand:+ start:2937 stop:3674 length:738 start_codon:yes stop_codon:yes gene_type:complete